MNKLFVIIGSGGLGHKLPLLQGTFGTIEAMVLYLVVLAWAPEQANLWAYGFIILFTVLSMVLGGLSEQYFKTKDPRPFVLDELAGFFCAVIFLPTGYFYIIGAFILFRIFDIWKPFPIRRLQDLPAGVGIVADDLLAGFYANICCQIIRYLI
jgi:phosphatidylglycerophosphatase A